MAKRKTDELLKSPLEIRNELIELRAKEAKEHDFAFSDMEASYEFTLDKARKGESFLSIQEINDMSNEDVEQLVRENVDEMEHYRVRNYDEEELYREAKKEGIDIYEPKKEIENIERGLIDAL